VLAVGFAFLFGYALTALPLLRSGLPVKIALASDTDSITLMEIVDHLIMRVIRGAMDAGLRDPLFWGSQTAALVIAGAAAFPLNRWLIDCGAGHAVVHRDHQHCRLGCRPRQRREIWSCRPAGVGKGMLVSHSLPAVALR